MTELIRRRREILALVPLVLIFLLLTWFQFRLFAISETLPFHYAIFFFGLVNLNLIIFLFLIFLIFKNLVKVFSESKIPVFGRTLKAKLVVAFFTFAFVPTFLMFLVSIFYINSSFDRWFAIKSMGILDDSIQITELYYQNLKKENYFFASMIEGEIKSTQLNTSIKSKIQNIVSLTQLDAVEVYDLQKKHRWSAYSEENENIVLPEISWKKISQAALNKDASSLILDVKQGRLIRTLTTAGDGNLVVVINRLIPFFLVEQINNIIESRDDYRSTTPFEFPLKTIYLITLVLMTLMILLGGTWFGLYLAGQLSSSLEKLGQASRDIAKGEYKPIEISTGSYEIERLVKNFNNMSHQLQKSRLETESANGSLKTTLTQLQKSKNYIQTIVENISTSVLSVNTEDQVTLLNRSAIAFLGLKTSPTPDGDTAGKVLKLEHIEEVLAPDMLAVYKKLKTDIEKSKAEFETTEQQIVVGEQILKLKCVLSCLKFDNNEIIGFIFAFEDISPLAKAQRAEAWTEVATRVAHEIKNPLTPIKLSAERLQKKFPDIDQETFDQCTKMIIQQVDIVKNLVNEFSYHARLPKQSLTKTSLNKIIEDHVWPYKQKLKFLEINFNKDETLPEIFVDKDQMKRIIINLLDNATDALKNILNPRLDIKTLFLKDKNMIQVAVADNGPGIHETELTKVFQPNYTTKASGTGLGLSIVKKMIEEHGGQISVSSYDGKTEFIFELPVKLIVNHKVEL